MFLRFLGKSLQQKCFVIVFILFCQSFLGQQEPHQLTKYAHSDFVKLITTTKDSVFNLKDAFIYFDKEKDSSFFYQNREGYFVFETKDTIEINAKINLKNVHFENIFDQTGVALHHLKFNKKVFIENTASVLFSNCVFEKGLFIDVNTPITNYIDFFAKKYDNYGNTIGINESTLKGDIHFEIGTIETFIPIFLNISRSTFIKSKNDKNAIYTNNIRAIDILDNYFTGEGMVRIFIDTSKETQILYNDFGTQNVLLHQRGVTSSTVNFILENRYRKHVLLEVDEFSKTDIYRWNEWADNVLSYQGYSEYVRGLYSQRALNNASLDELFHNDSILNIYTKKHKFQIENSYKYEKRLLGSFYDFYKSQHDTDFSNVVYVHLKDLETKRFQFLDEKESTFKTYFTWKINQFLKVFSAYGTEPSKSIIMSIYVVFIFAFIYFFFPNSWDTINRNRLMKRIRFYTRYFRDKESMKDIYQEEKKEELMTFNEFKEYMHKSQKETPSYFLFLAKPIYYFSSTNYKIISKLFDKTDFLKGKWIDLPKKKKILASIFMGIWIVFLLFLDILLKFINALTLSLNTFTTLGFGEIPTKGLPRYLSIIQGFIGWFMLTIFSVSLISQLLN